MRRWRQELRVVPVARVVILLVIVGAVVYAPAMLAMLMGATPSAAIALNVAVAVAVTFLCMALNER